MDASCPMIVNGCSTGCPPIHVRIKRFATKIQYRIWVIGRKVRLRCFEVWRNGRKARIRIDMTRATTPPSLFGIERKIA